MSGDDAHGGRRKGGKMTASIRFWVAAWSAWDERDDTLVSGGAVQARPQLPQSLRRRVTAIGRKALQAAWAVLPDQVEPRLVLASRHGEYDRTIGLLDSLAADGAVSPAEFSLSVHHALVGLLSIATGNRQGHSAVAAGTDSCGYGLIEAASFVAEQSHPAVVICFDALLPEIYHAVAVEPCLHPLALAVLMVPPSWPGAVAIDMEFTPRSPGAEICLNQSLVQVLRHGGEQKARGGRHDWRWRHAA